MPLFRRISLPSTQLYLSMEVWRMWQWSMELWCCWSMKVVRQQTRRYNMEWHGGRMPKLSRVWCDRVVVVKDFTVTTGKAHAPPSTKPKKNLWKATNPNHKSHSSKPINVQRLYTNNPKHWECDCFKVENLEGKLFDNKEEDESWRRSRVMQWRESVIVRDVMVYWRWWGCMNALSLFTLRFI